ncbi:MAG: DUF6473 family protein [Pseudomonadota bacterium]
MADIQIDNPLFDYNVYRFGRSRQLFRGPQPDLRGRYLAFLGGSSTFGRYVDAPFPSLVGEDSGVNVANLGADGAGPGFFMNDPEVMNVASDASLTIVQVMCTAANSNRRFLVRPRRNIRLQAVSVLLTGIYPEVDFGAFAYTKAMLKFLHNQDRARFRLVVNEMRNAWIGRMQSLLSSIETKTLLFWFSERDPDDHTTDSDDPTDMKYPLFVDQAMIDAIMPAADGFVSCVTRSGLPHDLRVDGKTVLYRPSGAPINENVEYPSPDGL